MSGAHNYHKTGRTHRFSSTIQIPNVCRDRPMCLSFFAIMHPPQLNKEGNKMKYHVSVEFELVADEKPGEDVICHVLNNLGEKVEVTSYCTEAEEFNLEKELSLYAAECSEVKEALEKGWKPTLDQFVNMWLDDIHDSDQFDYEDVANMIVTYWPKVFTTSIQRYQDLKRMHYIETVADMFLDTLDTEED